LTKAKGKRHKAEVRNELSLAHFSLVLKTNEKLAGASWFLTSAFGQFVFAFCLLPSALTVMR